jgi:tetratricopeptide (TPR) repeat protein
VPARTAIGWALALALCVASTSSAADGPGDYAAGLEAFEAERYPEARAALERAVAADPDHARALLLLGMSELALGDAEAALVHFEAARRADPSLEQLALYHEGLAHAQAVHGSEARDALERSIEADSGSRVAAGARGLLASLDPGPQRRFRLATRVGIEFDDNVTVPEIDATSDEADAAFVADLAGSYRLFDAEGAVVEAGYDFAQSLHFELSEADLQSHGVWLDGSHALGALDAGLGYRFGASTLGGDGFLHLHEVRPRLAVPVRPGWTAELAVAYLNKDFLDSGDRDRDGHHVSAGVRNFFLVPDRKVRVDAGLRFEAEDARGAEFDYLGFSAGTGLRVPFEWRGEWRFDLAYRLRLRDYSSETPSIGEARLDVDHGVGVGLVRRLTRYVEAQLDYRFTGADSNLPSADYLDNTVGLSLRVSL